MSCSRIIMKALPHSHPTIVSNPQSPIFAHGSIPNLKSAIFMPSNHPADSFRSQHPNFPKISRHPTLAHLSVISRLSLGHLSEISLRGLHAKNSVFLCLHTTSTALAFNREASSNKLKLHFVCTFLQKNLVMSEKNSTFALPNG